MPNEIRGTPPAAGTTTRQSLPAVWPWHVALVLVLAALDLALALAFQHLAAAIVPVPFVLLAAYVAGGTASGLVALALWHAEAGWAWAQPLAVVACGAPPIVADVLTARAALADPLAFGLTGSGNWVPVLLYVVAATLIATVLPLLLDKPRRAIPGLAVLFAVCAVALSTSLGAPVTGSGTAPVPQSPVETMLAILDRAAGWVLCVAVITALGVSWLRAEVRSWRSEHLELWGEVFWSGAIRPVALLCAVVALVAALPIALPHVPGFEHAWQQLNPLRGGTFSSTQQGGSPMLEPGAALPLNAGAPPDGATLILRYSVQADTSGETLAPPLIVATLDTFDGVAWTLNSARRTVAASSLSALQAPVGASGTVTAQITLVTPLPGGYLAGPDTPLSYSGVPGGAQAQVSAPGGALGIDGWQAVAALHPGASYTVSSAILAPADALAAEAVNPATVPAQLLAVPSDMPTDLRSLMQRDAAAWTTGVTTPAAKAQAIANALRAGFHLNTADPAPGAPWAALRSYFLTGRGNASVWVTAHALLCRMAGIPTRIIEGFEPGTLDLPTGVRLVRARDFTFYAQVATVLGWARIGVLDNVQSVTRAVPAPTATGNASTHPTPTPQPKAARSSAPPPVQQTLPPPFHLPPLSSSSAVLYLLLLLLLVLAVLLCGTLAVLLARWQHRRRQSLEQQAARLLGALVRPAARAGIPVSRGDTPLGFAVRMVALLPDQAGQALWELAHAYTHSVYAVSGIPAFGAPDAPGAPMPLDGALLARAEAATRVAHTVLRSHRSSQSHRSHLSHRH